MVDAMDIGPFIVWAAALSTVTSLGTTLYTALTAGSRKNDTRIADLTCKLEDTERAQGAKLVEAERRMQRLEDRLATVPTAEMMHRLELQYTTLMGELGRIDERLKPVAAIAERMQDLLVEKARAA